MCGSGIAERNFSTLGYERKHNPVLQMTDREEFIRFKVNEEHFLPPYFRQMEKYNLEGAPPLAQLPIPKPLSSDEFARAADGGMLVVDIRSPEAYAGASRAEELLPSAGQAARLCRNVSRLRPAARRDCRAGLLAR